MRRGSSALLLLVHAFALLLPQRAPEFLGPGSCTPGIVACADVVPALQSSAPVAAAGHGVRAAEPLRAPTSPVDRHRWFGTELPARTDDDRSRAASMAPRNDAIEQTTLRERSHFTASPPRPPPAHS
jgi:hypothetical protein